MSEAEKHYYQSSYEQALLLYQLLDEMVSHFHVKLRLGLCYKYDCLFLGTNQPSEEV